MDAPLSDLGCAAALHTDCAGGHATGLSARGRAHAGAGSASGASHSGVSEAGLPALQQVINDLQALRGIADISAVTIAAELGQVSRFDSARQLMGYCGAVP